MHCNGRPLAYTSRVAPRAREGPAGRRLPVLRAKARLIEEGRRGGPTHRWGPLDPPAIPAARRGAARLCRERVRGVARPGSAFAARASSPVGPCGRGPGGARRGRTRTCHIRSRATSGSESGGYPTPPMRSTRVEQRYQFATGELHLELSVRRRRCRAMVDVVTFASRTSRRLVLQEVTVETSATCDVRLRASVDPGLDTRDVAARGDVTPGDEEPAVDGAMWWRRPGTRRPWRRVRHRLQ